LLPPSSNLDIIYLEDITVSNSFNVQSERRFLARLQLLFDSRFELGDLLLLAGTLDMQLDLLLCGKAYGLNWLLAFHVASLQC